MPLALALRTALGLRRSEEKVLVISMKMVFKMSIDGQYLHFTFLEMKTKKYLFIR